MRTMRITIMICTCMLLSTIIASAQSGKESTRVLSFENQGKNKGVLVQNSRNSRFKNIAFVLTAESVHSLPNLDYLKHNGLKYSVGAEYVLPLGKIGGVGLGARYGICNFNLESKEFFYSCNVYDDENDNLEYKAHGRDLKEKQIIHIIEIPVYYHYRLKNLCFKVGPEIAIPISAKGKTVSGNVELSGYYPKYNVELKDLPNHGFGKYDVVGRQNVLDTKVAWGINAYFGYCFPLKIIDINLGIGVKYLFNGYIDTMKKYLDYPGSIKSLSYTGKKSGYLSWGLSLGIGL